MFDVNLDRFSQGLPDPQDVLPVAYCEHCGGEIYPREEVYCVDNFYMVHSECICDFVHENYHCNIDTLTILLFKTVIEEQWEWFK